MRLKNVEIHNLKNVEYGNADLISVQSSASVYGLYGQNGSGKTTLINAIALLKDLISQEPICSSQKYDDLITADKDEARVLYTFTHAMTSNGALAMGQPDLEFEYVYEVVLVKKPEESPESFLIPTESTTFPAIKSEALSFSITVDGVKRKKTLVIDTSKGDVFGPRAKYIELIENTREVKNNLTVEKIMAYKEGRSFVFSSALATEMLKKCFPVESISNLRLSEEPLCDVPFDDTERKPYEVSMELMIDPYSEKFNPTIFGVGYQDICSTGRRSLIIVDNHFTGETIPVYLRFGEYATLPVNFQINEPTLIYKEGADQVIRSIRLASSVMSAIIPGLDILAINLGDSIAENGAEVTALQLVVSREGKIIPMSAESYGIRKLFAIVQLLIDMYNNENAIVVIDELDSGVFEYLLGEVVRIVSENGMGQLIFTSHNLRLLETLNKNCIGFTTTNPANRYIKMKNIKKNNNLRDSYYRNIVLGGQNESLYNETSNSEISLAFMLAGLNEEAACDSE